MNKKFFSVVVMVFVIMCFSSVCYAGIDPGISVCTETVNTRKEDVVLVEKTDCILLTPMGWFTPIDATTGDELSPTARITEDLTISVETRPYEAGLVNNPVITYTDADGNKSEVDISFQVVKADGSVQVVSPANSQMFYYKDDSLNNSSFMYNFNGELEIGDELQIVYVGPDGTPIKTENLGNIGEDVAHNQVEYNNGGIISDMVGKVFEFVIDATAAVESLLVELLLKLGDGILYLITTSVGETVTIDRLIFNGVDKVNINYWQDGFDGSVKSTMASVISPWYKLFYKISAIVFMIMLVVVGIQVLLNSTAEKKAKYKDVIVSWVVGIMILTLFPYVLKYIVMLNDTGITALHAYYNEGDSMSGSAGVPEIITMGRDRAMSLFGSVEFVDALVAGGLVGSDGTVDMSNAEDMVGDAMLLTRLHAQYRSSIILVAIYFIFMGQTIVLLFMYYKRAFMIAFLMVIFPLVAMTYVLDKVGDKKAQSFEIWFKEFIVNVVVQLFHAVVYVVIVGGSVKMFIQGQGSNWLFTLISVLFLFQGERILRNIFGIKSSANTITDLAKTGAVIWGAREVSKLIKGAGSDTATRQDSADVAAANSRNAMRAGIGAGAAGATAQAGTVQDNRDRGLADGVAQGGYTGNDPDGVATNDGYDGSAARDSVTESATRRRVKLGLASRVAKNAGSVIGTTMGATYAMAKGNTSSNNMVENIVSDGASGAMFGKLAATPAVGAINKAEQMVHGHVESKKIENGSMDEKLKLNAPPGAFVPQDVDLNAVVGKNGETLQEIYRQALAEMTKVAATKGRVKGEKAYWNYIEENVVNR